MKQQKLNENHFYRKIYRNVHAKKGDECKGKTAKISQATRKKNKKNK
jgi:hypothetical protein